MAGDSSLTCNNCGDLMKYVTTMTYPDGAGPILEAYECERSECGRKAVLAFQPQGGLTKEHESWVDQELRRTGSFFPSDWTGSRGPRGRY